MLYPPVSGGGFSEPSEESSENRGTSHDQPKYRFTGAYKAPGTCQGTAFEYRAALPPALTGASYHDAASEALQRPVRGPEAADKESAHKDPAVLQASQ